MTRIYEVDGVELFLSKSNPPILLAVAWGRATSSGWKNIRLVPVAGNDNSDGVLELELLGDKPTGISLAWLAPVSDSYETQDNAAGITTVIVHGRTNTIKAHVASASSPQSIKPPIYYERPKLGDNSPYIHLTGASLTEATVGAGLVNAANFGNLAHLSNPGSAAPRAAGIMPTFEVGEDFKSLALGEEKSPVVGEETKSPVLGEEWKTMAIGEEQPTWWDQRAETPPYPWHVEIMAGGGGTTNPASDTAQNMFAFPFGRR